MYRHKMRIVLSVLLSLAFLVWPCALLAVELDSDSIRFLEYIHGKKKTSGLHRIKASLMPN